MHRKSAGRVKLIEVRRHPGDPRRGLLQAGGLVFPCALGRGGTTALKREGDGATPLGLMRPLYGYFRADRRRAGPPPTRLALTPIDAHAGWCDAPADRNYNRPVRLPYAASAECMRRRDRLYDICIVLDWNMRPARRGRGSAIFLHVAGEGYPPTAGCIALPPAAMARLLPLIGRETRIRVYR